MKFRTIFLVLHSLTLHILLGFVLGSAPLVKDAMAADSICVYSPESLDTCPPSPYRRAVAVLGPDKNPGTPQHVRVVDIKITSTSPFSYAEYSAFTGFSGPWFISSNHKVAQNLFP